MLNVTSEGGAARGVGVALVTETTDATPTVAYAMPTDQEAFDAVIAAQGNLRLAAERLGCTTSDLISSIRGRVHELKEYMQVVATLELFSFMPILHKTLVENLTALEPGDAVNAYMKLMDQITKITDDKTMTLNINDAAVRHIRAAIPAEVYNAWIEESAS